jgi:hypothetical protein
MKLKHVFLAISLIGVAIAALQVSHKMLVVRAVAAPHASGASVLRSVLRPKYQVVAPHRSILSDFKMQIVPEASACSQPPCNGLTSKAQCMPGCGFCGHCPDCWNGPCTIYGCESTPLNRRCEYISNTNPKCTLLCADSQNKSCICLNCASRPPVSSIR